MTVFTVTLVVLLVISSGHIYGHPSASSYHPIVDYGHGFKLLQSHHLLNNDNQHITSNMDDADQPLLSYIYHPRKRLIDF
ncbi:unnamed protein product [Rotaria sp. Silwood2]|nr:unnamed protein product [Rotaria sp. Silwood2]CAF2908801.1 unnamed protein product [Rotaria sp. Silwood2]CAF3025076.1 unnamed protein product [Rotaria sp. Silwood2]CAF4018689.1 unnamed protein product [Rotaria sp. Silwood2]CAF4045566.1 unnamed protein product [Rotaria sp. Silwood2]